MRPILLLLVLSLTPACKDETLSGHGADREIWQLQSLDGEPYAARATLMFPDEGSFVGEAPCNSYSGHQSAPYPQFAAGNIITTRMTCPDIDLETRYLRALSELTDVNITESRLTLSNKAGRELIFVPED